MIVLKHMLIGLQIELSIIDRVLTKRDRSIFINDAAYFYCLACLQTDLLFIPQNVDVLSLVGFHLEAVFFYLSNLADESDCAADKVLEVGCGDEWMRLSVHILHFFGHLNTILAISNSERDFWCTLV